MNSINGLILATNKGASLKSSLPKFLHPLAGRALIHYVLDTVENLQPAHFFVVVSQETKSVKTYLEGCPVPFLVHESPPGAVYAIQACRPFWENLDGTLLVLPGDAPLIRAETLRQMIATHQKHQVAATLLTTQVKDSSPHHTVLRDGQGKVRSIGGNQESALPASHLSEINSGMYLFEIAALREAMRELSIDPPPKDSSLAECCTRMISQGRSVEAVICDDPREVAVVQNRINLAQMEKILRERILKSLMLSGVTILDPSSTYIDRQVQIGADTVIYPNVFIEGNTAIGSECRIYPHSRITNSTVGNGVTIFDCCVIAEATIRDAAQIGPFARLRPLADIGENSHIGNFVEVKNSKIGPDTKAMHHSYLGDAIIGEKVNIGAGTITCNFDGVKKSQTIIGDGAFIGSDSQLIAPVMIGQDAYVAAGSSICEDVPADSLGIARSRQVTKEGWARKRREKKEGKQERSSPCAEL
jgi:bifunctional UDP-N-acetylglucosamine pyrophosphorylase / glucosamine-1-phosphate N-acetyltransferase